MTDVNPLYVNSFGIAFEWPTTPSCRKKKIQLVFRDIGLLLSTEELKQFLKNIQHTEGSCSLCKDCGNNDTCKALLVNSPVQQISFAMNVKELKTVKDLVENTLFHVGLNGLLEKLLHN